MAKKKEVSAEVAQVNGFALWKVHQSIDDLVTSQIDPETGEINAVAAAHLNTLELRREDAIHGLTLCHLQNSAKAEVVDKEIERLLALKQAIDKRALAAKRILEQELQDGESFEFENCKISWKKNPSSVDFVNPDATKDELAAIIEDIEFEFPEIIKIETKKSLMKKEAKAILESGKEIPGLRLITDKKSLQIK